MKDSVKQIQNFQEQLQGKLSKLTQIKSQKKLKYKSPLSANNIELETFSNIESNLTNKKVQKNKYNEQPKYSIISQSGQKDRSNFSSNRKGTSYAKIKTQKMQEKIRDNAKAQTQIKSSRFSKDSQLLTIITNKQIYSIVQSGLEQGQTQQNILDISYFLAKCLAKYTKQAQISEQQIKLIYLQLQKQITTTDLNKLSINALELAVKKMHNSLQLYIVQKILKSKHDFQLTKLRQKQRKLEELGQALQQNFNNKQKQMKQAQKSLSQRQKQLAKKQKMYTNKQKQFMQRIKNHKRMLQQKAEKLVQKFQLQISNASQKVQKKINTYERNMKYRIQTMAHKAHQIQRQRQFKEQEVKINTIKQMQQNFEKIVWNKQKKYDSQTKQLVQKLQQKHKKIKQIQQENNKLVKICSKLESRLSKDEAKIKSLMQELDSRNNQLRQLQYLCSQKENENEHLISKIFETSNNQTELVNQVMSSKKQSRKIQNKSSQGKINVKQSKISQNQSQIQRNKSKKSLNLKKKKNGQSIEQRYNKKIKQIIQCYQIYLEQICPRIRNIQLSQASIINLMLISTKLVTSQQRFRGTATVLLQHIVANFLNPTYLSKRRDKKQFKIKKHQDFDQIKQISNTLKKYVQNIQKSKSYPPNLWRLQVVLCLLSKKQQAFYWLIQVNKISQIGKVQQQMLEQGSQQDNFVLALAIKFIIQQMDQSNIEVLTILSDFILNFKIMNDRANPNFWKTVIGQQILYYFSQIVRRALKDNKFYQSYSQNIQRISIMIQRLVVGYDIKVRSEFCQYFENLRAKCQGTLLYRNLTSIINNFQSQSNANILMELNEN